MSAECNACYLASTRPVWIAEIVVRNRADQPCAQHRPCERCSLSDDYCAEHGGRSMMTCVLAEQGEPDWEWAVQTTFPESDGVDSFLSQPTDRETADAIMRWGDEDAAVRHLYRRRKASPWELVEGNMPHTGGTEDPIRRIDEICARLDVDLLPWQRDFLEAYLRGGRLTLMRGRKQGWSTLQRVFDELSGHALIGPDCRDGKHPACDGRAFNSQADEIVDCECMCHFPEAA